MYSMIKTVTLIFILAVAGGATAGPGVDVGDQAPQFTLADSAGNEIGLADFKGKIVVLEWTNPDCPFVKRHNQEGTMGKLESTYAKGGVVWLTINSTHYMDSAANAAYVKKEGITWPVLVDQDGAVGHAYGAATTPHMFIIGGKGTVVYEGAIDDDPRGNMEADARTNYVSGALNDLAAGKAVATPETKPYGCSVKYKK